jgi:hypothetical protein
VWIFTETGFVSAVSDREIPGQLVVRARDRAALEPLQVAIFAMQEQEVAILNTPEADYPYRLYVDQNIFARWAAHSVRDITYSNFKGRCASTLPVEYSDALHDVWSAMHQVEDADARPDYEENTSLGSVSYLPTAHDVLN